MIRHFSYRLFHHCHLRSGWRQHVFDYQRSVDPSARFLTLADCVRLAGAECVSEEGKAACSAAAGTCVMERDGYYTTTAFCLGIGLILLVAYIIPTAKKLQGLFAALQYTPTTQSLTPHGPVTALPLSKWRVPIS